MAADLVARSQKSKVVSSPGRSPGVRAPLTDHDSLYQRFSETRATSLELAAPLGPEDMVVQAMDDASPTKWHLGHVTWFFETFILRDHLPGYKPFDKRFAYCFNSYYEAAGPRHPRPRRGLLTRPTIIEVMAYRHHVDAAMAQLFDNDDVVRQVCELTEIGINHEQQHQELLLSDILSLFALSPLQPAYRETARLKEQYKAGALKWIAFDGGLKAVGHDGDGFSYDNETPRHDVLLHPHQLADRLVTNGEWIQFMEDGGYRTAAHWLSDGWAFVQREDWTAPLYWQKRDDHWWKMSLAGCVPVDLAAPVCHVSYFEADAFARWAGRRLPTEFEWENAAADVAVKGNMLGSGALRTRPAPYADNGKPKQMFGDVWEWTQSSYAPYPGYAAAPGAIGEYNGKFMCGQYVLKGASCVTAERHSRNSYRNFFYPHQRWQFTGLRLAKDA